MGDGFVRFIVDPLGHMRVRRARREADRARSRAEWAEMNALRAEQALREQMLRSLAHAIRETSHCSHLATDILTILDEPIEELVKYEAD